MIQELRERLEVRLTHHSTAIEGNTLTQSETQIVLEKGVTIGGKSLLEHLEVIGHRDALVFMLELADAGTALSEWNIREIHNLVMKGVDSPAIGAYRNLNVKAAGTEYRYPDHLRLQDLMAEFVLWWNEEIDLHPVAWASEAHLRFVTIHAFADGNGRVGRLLLNLALVRTGYPLAVIPVQQCSEYISALTQGQGTNDRAALDGPVMEAVERSLLEVLELCER